MRSAAGISLILLGVLACSAPPEADSDDGTWVGTITTEGNVTTVINESGSVWGGTATLVEEASIGSEGSSEEYLFGQVRDLATDGERIFVADSQVVLVKVYDLEGRHLMDLGGRGEGPGEFREAKGVGVTDEGRILVQDDRGRKIHVFDSEGTYLESWDRQFGSAFYDGRFTVTSEGPFILQTLNPEAPSGEQRSGMVLYGPGGAAGTTIEAPALETVENSYVRYDVEGAGSGVAPVPFVPQSYWVMGPDATLVAGFGGRYRFQVQHPDGSITVVERFVSPVPLQPAEFEWAKGNILATFRQRAPGWTWNGPDAAAMKPFFERLFLGAGGRVWVLRELQGERATDCASDTDELSERLARPCWQSPRVFDIFAPDGRFLTTVPAPDRLRTEVWPVIDGEILLVAEEDEQGNVLVKRYRLVLPGEE